MYTICPKCRTPYQGMGSCVYCGVALIDHNAYMLWLQQQQQLMQQPQQQQQLPPQQQIQQRSQQPYPLPPQPQMQAQPIPPHQSTTPNVTNNSQTVIFMPNMQLNSTTQPQSMSNLQCKRCGSNNISCQAVNEVYSRTQHRGILWWIFVGWWWLPIKWLIFTLPALIVKMFSRRRTYVTSKTVTKAVCQNCGFTWNC